MAKIKTKKIMPPVMNAYYRGYVIRRDNDKLFLPPSSFAEALFGYLPDGFWKTLFKDLKSENLDDLPALKNFIGNEGTFEDLEEAIQKGTGTYKLVREQGSVVYEAGDEKQSGHNTYSMNVGAREDARGKNAQSIWNVKVTSPERLETIETQCPCGLESHLKDRGNFFTRSEFGYIKFLDKKGLINSPQELINQFEVNVADYHVAQAMIRLAEDDKAVLPFNMLSQSNPELALEAAVMRYVYGKDYEEIDSFLLDKDIESPHLKSLIENGKATREVIKSKRAFPISTKIWMLAIDYVLRNHGCEFDAFTEEFVGSEKETIGLAYTDGKRDYRVVVLPDMMLPVILEKSSSGTKKTNNGVKLPGIESFSETDTHKSRDVDVVVRIPYDEAFTAFVEIFNNVYAGKRKYIREERQEINSEILRADRHSNNSKFFLGGLYFDPLNFVNAKIKGNKDEVEKFQKNCTLAEPNTSSGLIRELNLAKIEYLNESVRLWNKQGGNLKIEIYKPYPYTTQK